MSIFERHNTGMKPTAEGDTYHEQWVAGTYIVAGVFQKQCSNLNVDQAIMGIAPLFNKLRVNKRAWWPKGICAYYAIPIYTSGGFDQSVIDWVHSRPRGRYAMWHEPVIYDRVKNVAEINASWGIVCAAYRVFLFEAMHAALAAVSQKEGHARFPLVNGK